MTKLLKNAPLGLLSWLIVVTVWLIWEPVEVEPGWGPQVKLWQGDIDTIAHLLLLVPIAVVLAVAAYRTKSRWPILQPIAILTLLGLVLEFGQFWVKGRAVSLDDLIANLSGAALAVWLTTSLLRRGIRAPLVLGVITGLVYGSVLIGTGYKAVAFNENFRLAEWDPHFQVLVGDEFQAERKYEGRVLFARICAGEATKEVCIEPGANDHDRRLLTEVAKKSQRCAIFARVNSGTDDQVGPARIVTFSLGSEIRNISLAQKGQDLVFRIRTPQTGPNGVRPQFNLPGAVPTGIPTEVGAVFSNGVVTMTAQSQAELVSAEFRPGLLRNWLLQRSLVGFMDLRSMESTARNVLLGAFVLIAPLAFGAGWLLRTRWLTALLACPALAAAALWAIDTWVLSTLPPSLFELTVAGGAAALGVALARCGIGREAQQ